MFGSEKLSCVAGLVLAWVWIMNVAVGQDSYPSTIAAENREASSELDLAARVAALETQLKNGSSPSDSGHGGGCATCGGGCCDTCGCASCGCDCCNGCCDPCCRSDGFYGGA